MIIIQTPFETISLWNHSQREVSNFGNVICNLSQIQSYQLRANINYCKLIEIPLVYIGYLTYHSVGLRVHRNEKAQMIFFNLPKLLQVRLLASEPH